mmetsp:Transcript_3435/g.4266  ORF Transcript_3435/g.4266 Transcript_3435/m.4266 type:complete len:80 (+) Transcript_3435:986-1225(+)
MVRDDAKLISKLFSITNSIQQSFVALEENPNSSAVSSLLDAISEQMWEHFKCPITQDIMREPVISSDGYSVCNKFVSLI